MYSCRSRHQRVVLVQGAGDPACECSTCSQPGNATPALRDHKVAQQETLLRQPVPHRHMRVWLLPSYGRALPRSLRSQRRLAQRRQCTSGTGRIWRPACMRRPCSQRCTVIEDRLVPEQVQPFLFWRTICILLGQAGSYQRGMRQPRTPVHPEYHFSLHEAGWLPCTPRGRVWRSLATPMPQAHHISRNGWF